MPDSMQRFRSHRSRKLVLLRGMHMRRALVGILPIPTKPKPKTHWFTRPIPTPLPVKKKKIQASQQT